MSRTNKIFNYIKSNQEHSTMVGKIIMVDHSDNESQNEEIMEFSEWMNELMNRVEDYAKKTSKNKKH